MSSAAGSDCVKVAVRVRPFVPRETDRGCVSILDKTPGVPQIEITGESNSKGQDLYTFNHVFMPGDTQEKVYLDCVQPMIGKLFEGYNTILPYGRTGSGKTYSNEKGQEQWYKFDDGEVSECKIHEDEELKAQCYGGDYMGEVFGNNLKRMQFRRQKRWWNAYMLFYTRTDYVQASCIPSVEQLSLAESKSGIVPMPEPIERSLRLQNVRFTHGRSLYSIEFFNFVRNLVSCSIPLNKFEKTVDNSEELSLLSSPM